MEIWNSLSVVDHRSGWALWRWRATPEHLKWEPVACCLRGGNLLQVLRRPKQLHLSVDIRSSQGQPAWNAAVDFIGCTSHLNVSAAITLISACPFHYSFFLSLHQISLLICLLRTAVSIGERRWGSAWILAPSSPHWFYFFGCKFMSRMKVLRDAKIRSLSGFKRNLHFSIQNLKTSCQWLRGKVGQHHWNAKRRADKPSRRNKLKFAYQRYENSSILPMIDPGL